MTCPNCAGGEVAEQQRSRLLCHRCQLTFFPWATLGGEYLTLVRPRGSAVGWHIEMVDKSREKMERVAAGINANEHYAVREARVVACGEYTPDVSVLTEDTPQFGQMQLL